MPGIIYRVIPKQLFTVPGGSLPFSWWFAKAIDISTFREAQLIVRAHNGTNVSAGSLTVAVYQDGSTAEDTAEFVGAQLCSVAIDSTVGPSKNLLFAAFAPGSGMNLPALVRVQLLWAFGSVGPAIISADINAKS